MGVVPPSAHPNQIWQMVPPGPVETSFGAVLIDRRHHTALVFGAKANAKLQGGNATAVILHTTC